jgi:hypothetical protein
MRFVLLLGLNVFFQFQFRSLVKVDLGCIYSRMLFRLAPQQLCGCVYGFLGDSQVAECEEDWKKITDTRLSVNAKAVT